MTNTPGTIVLQWLTYVFWGWTVLSAIWLVYIVVANLIVGTDLSAVIPYAIAAIFVLLPLSFVCDLFFSRKETTKKTGAATIVMVIHAVIFALFGIGILISAVFTLVAMLINGVDDAKISISVLVTLFISAMLYGFTFLRTINFTDKLPIGTVYRYGMVGFLGILIVLAFVGPVARSAATRDDRDIVDNISTVTNGIENYVQANKKLPAGLGDISVDEKGKALIDKGLVTYKAEGKEMSFNDYQSSSLVEYDYKYQLCATFKEASSNSKYGLSSRDKDTYQSYLSVYSHGAGQQCYKMKVTRSE